MCSIRTLLVFKVIAKTGLAKIEKCAALQLNRVLQKTEIRTDNFIGPFIVLPPPVTALIKPDFIVDVFGVILTNWRL